MTSPPEDTRAFFRGECLRRYGPSIAAASWDSVIFDVGRDSLVRVPMLEPQRGTRAHVGELLDRCSDRGRADRGAQQRSLTAARPSARRPSDPSPSG